MNEDARNVLRAKLVDLMMSSANKGDRTLTNLYLEIIAIMSRRYVQRDWPNLFPSLINYLANMQDFNV